MGAFKYAVVLLGVIFTASGVAKLIPAGSVYEHMTKEFVRFSSVFPLVSLGFKPDPAQYQFVIGVINTVCGLLLLFGSPRLQKLAASVLLVIMAGAVWTLYHLHLPPQKVAFPAVCGFGLLIFLLRGEKPKTE